MFDSITSALSGLREKTPTRVGLETQLIVTMAGFVSEDDDPEVDIVYAHIAEIVREKTYVGTMTNDDRQVLVDKCVEAVKVCRQAYE